MRSGPAQRVFAFVAALLIAAASVVSAARMAPAQTEGPELAAYLAAGGKLLDLCGDVHAGHDHHCPFCRLLDAPPRVDFASPAARLARLLDGAPRGYPADIPRAVNPRVLARAPPVTI